MEKHSHNEAAQTLFRFRKSERKLCRKFSLNKKSTSKIFLKLKKNCDIIHSLEIFLCPSRHCDDGPRPRLCVCVSAVVCLREIDPCWTRTLLLALRSRNRCNRHDTMKYCLGRCGAGRKVCTAVSGIKFIFLD